MKAQDFLEKEAINNAFSHAYLFFGKRHLAKEAIDYIIKAKKILPEDISIIKPSEFESGKKAEIKIDEVRSFLRQTNLSPQGKERLAIIYDAEKLNSSSGNLLLKNLEEPAVCTTFILTAGNTNVLPTIKSRCRILIFNAVDADEKVEDEKFIPEMKKGFPEASRLIEKIVKENKSGEIISELIKNQRQKLLFKKDNKYAENLEEIESAKKKIDQNGNQRLVLECLILKIGKDL